MHDIYSRGALSLEVDYFAIDEGNINRFKIIEIGSKKVDFAWFNETRFITGEYQTSEMLLYGALL